MYRIMCFASNMVEFDEYYEIYVRNKLFNAFYTTSNQCDFDDCAGKHRTGDLPVD